MATKNLVPRGNNEGKIGITDRKWSEAHFVSGSFDSLSVSNIYGNDGTTNLIVADANSSISVDKNSDGTFTIGGGGSGSGTANKIQEDNTYVLVSDSGSHQGKILFYHDNTLSWELHSDVLKPQLTNTVMIGSDQKRIKAIWLSEDQDALNIGAAKIKFDTDKTRLRLSNDNGSTFHSFLTEADLSSYLTEETQTLDDVVAKGASTSSEVTINNIKIGSNSKEITDLISIKTTSNDNISIMPDGSGVTQIGGETAGTDSVDIQSGLITIKSPGTPHGSKIKFYNSTNFISTTIKSNPNPTTNYILTLPNESGTLATKTYADSVAQGLKTQSPVKVATNAALSSNVDTTAQTLTNSSGTAELVVDGITLALDDRVLVKDNSNPENGIYKVTTAGGSAAWVLTRADDFNLGDSVSGFFTFVEQGTANADVGFVCTSDSPNDNPDGTNNITFSQFSHAGQINGGVGLTKDGNTLNVDDVLINVTSVGTLSELTVAGLSTLNNGLKIKGGSSNHVTVNAPSTLTNNYTLTLPVNVGDNGQVLKTDGEGALSWVTQTSGGLNSLSEDTDATLGSDLTISTFKIKGDLIPSADETYNLGYTQFPGSLNRKTWQNLYLADHIFFMRDSRLQLYSVKSGTHGLLLNQADNTKSANFEVRGGSTSPTQLILNSTNSGITNGETGQIKFIHSEVDRAVMQLKSSASKYQLKLNVWSSTLGLSPRIEIQPGEGTSDLGNIYMNMPLSLKSKISNGAPYYQPGQISFFGGWEKSASKTITLKAPDTIQDEYILTLPETIGNENDILSVDGSSGLKWVAKNSISFNVKDVVDTKSTLGLSDQFVISDNVNPADGVNKRISFSSIKSNIFSSYENNSPITLTYNATENEITGAISENGVVLSKLKKISSPNKVLGYLGAVTVPPTDNNVVEVDVEVASDNTWSNDGASDTKLATQKAIYDFVKSNNNGPTGTQASTSYEFDTTMKVELDNNAYDNNTVIELKTGLTNPSNFSPVIRMPSGILSYPVNRSFDLTIDYSSLTDAEIDSLGCYIHISCNVNDPRMFYVWTHGGASGTKEYVSGMDNYLFNFSSTNSPYIVRSSNRTASYRWFGDEISNRSNILGVSGLSPHNLPSGVTVLTKLQQLGLLPNDLSTVTKSTPFFDDRYTKQVFEGLVPTSSQLRNRTIYHIKGPVFSTNFILQKRVILVNPRMPFFTPPNPYRLDGVLKLRCVLREAPVLSSSNSITRILQNTSNTDNLVLHDGSSYKIATDQNLKYRYWEVVETD